MRLYCWFCGKSCSSEIPDETLVRACLVCPECIEAKRVLIPEPVPEPAAPPEAR